MLQKGQDDGSIFLDPNLDVFGPIVAKQPLFKAYLDRMFGSESLLSPDGSTKHLHWQLARAEALNPIDPTNVKTREKTITCAHAWRMPRRISRHCISARPRAISRLDLGGISAYLSSGGVYLGAISTAPPPCRYLEAQCAAGLMKMHDKKIAIADKLTSQDGANCVGKLAQAHEDLQGCYATNDELAESGFGQFTYTLVRAPGISREAASGQAQVRTPRARAPTCPAA